MKAKIFLIVAALLMAGASIAFGNVATPAYADDDCGPMTEFMGLTPWYKAGDGSCILDEGHWHEDKISVSVWTIVLNIVGDVVGVLGYLAIGLVIWGGYQYMLSQGDPGKAAKGKMTITHAMIGLVITILASTITKTIVAILGETKDTNIFIGVFNHAFTWAAIVAAIVIVIGGITYTTSTGDAGKVAKAKNTIMYAAIGLIITLLSMAIVNTVVGSLGS